MSLLCCVRLAKKLAAIPGYIYDGGCDKGIPQVLTNVAADHNWISEYTGLNLPLC